MSRKRKQRPVPSQKMPGKRELMREIKELRLEKLLLLRRAEELQEALDELQPADPETE